MESGEWFRSTCLVYLNHKNNVCWTFVSCQSFRISNVRYNFRHVHKLVVAFLFYAGKFYARTHGKITRSLWVEIHPYSHVTTSSKLNINYTNVPFLVFGKFKNRRRGESFRRICKGKRLIEIKHSILARTSLYHTFTISNFYLLPKSNTEILSSCDICDIN